MITEEHIPIEQQIGYLFEHRRLCLGRSTYEVAKAIGVTNRTYKKYEDGIIPMPINHFLALCKTLDVTPAEILAEIKEPQGGKMK